MRILKLIFYALLVRPFLILFLGMNVRHLERLELPDGAHVIAANHNSHLDSLVLMSLFPLSEIHKIKLVAAKDYWCKTRWLEWFSLNVIGVIPIERGGKGASEDPLAPVMAALADGYKVVIFPEGSRGEPEQRQTLKFGVAKILQQRPDVKITPVFMYGLGKALPRGEALFVPFVCEVNIGEELSWQGDRVALMEQLEGSFDQLKFELEPKEWL